MMIRLLLTLLLVVVETTSKENEDTLDVADVIGIVMDGPSPLELMVRSVSETVNSLKKDVSRLDMLIKFYHPEWTWTAARSCGIDCPYVVNLLDFAAVQWRFEGDFNGIFDLEFVDDQGKMRGNMDFYDRHMWLRGCGWLKYDEPAPLPANNGTLRTWAFAKADTGFKVYAEEKLLLEYTYAEGDCADMWSGGTAGFYFETPATAIHLVQHGMDMLWWLNE